jgi:nitrogen fixation protein FixH
MKLNWGHGIAIFFTLFVGSLVFQVIKSTQYDNSLVSDQYYKDDINYQKHYNKLVNSQELKQDLIIEKTEAGDYVELIFPKELPQVSGNIHFFCPSDSKGDFKLPISISNGKQVVPVEGLKKGLWRVKVNFEAGGKAYYKEEPVIL